MSRAVQLLTRYEGHNSPEFCIVGVYASVRDAELAREIDLEELIPTRPTITPDDYEIEEFAVEHVRRGDASLTFQQLIDERHPDTETPRGVVVDFLQNDEDFARLEVTPDKRGRRVLHRFLNSKGANEAAQKIVIGYYIEWERKATGKKRRKK